VNTKVAFAAAIILAVAAGVGVKTVIERYKSEIQESEDMVNVVIAERNLQPGDRLLKDYFKVVPVRGQLAQLGTITASNLGVYLGHELTRPVQTGDALNERDFYVPFAEQSFTEEELAPGYRAATIAVDQITGVAGLMRPGDRVDVLATIAYAMPGSSSRAAVETITLMENIKVLATDSQTNMPSSPYTRASRPDRTGGYSSVTLELTPAETRILTLAQSQASGRLTLTLRNPSDTTWDIPISSAETISDSGRTSLDNLMRAIEAAAYNRQNAQP